MSSRKRRSETGQSRREDYEELENSQSSAAFLTQDTGERMLASAEVMQNRRMVRPQRPLNKGHGGPKLPEPPTAATNKNPFASVTLLTGSSSGTPSFNFKPTVAVAAAPATAPSQPLSTKNNSNNNENGNENGGGNPVKANREAWCSALIQQDNALVNTIIESDLGNVNHSNVFWEYQFWRLEKEWKHAKKEEGLLGTGNKPTTGTQISDAAGDTSTEAVTAPGPANPSATCFSSSATSGPAFGKPITSGFNFGASSAPIVSQPTAKFSFGVPQTTPGGNGEIAVSESGDTPTAANTSAPDEQEQDEVRKNQDSNWDEVKEFPGIKVYRNENNNWIEFTEGLLLLEVEKDSNGKKYRMVMRNARGLKVIINMLITKSMLELLKLNIVKSKKTGKDAYGTISFWGINVDKRPEMFLMKTSVDASKSLHELIRELASKSESE